ncbi:hypothetical protein SRHO_G00124760 [Serrasalmus rhombeus]
MTVQGFGCCSTIRENIPFDVALTPVTEFEKNSRGSGKLIVGQNDNGVEAVVSNMEQFIVWLGQQLVRSQSSPGGDKHLLYFQRLVAQSFQEGYVGGNIKGMGEASSHCCTLSVAGRNEKASNAGLISFSV